MNKPAFLVEGAMEQQIVQDLCPGAAVRLLNCNGDQVALAAIASRVGTLARLLQKRFSPIFVVFDRERRAATTTQLRVELQKLVAQERISVPIVIGIPDRMIENWILADLESLSRAARIERTLFTPAFEGTCGEAKLKEMLPKDSVYVKTINGVRWFANGNPEVMKQNSPSFREFAEALSPVACRWLAQKRLVLTQ
jgi:hypothetical protein